MAVLRLIGNIIWFVLSGWYMGLGWLLASGLMFISIIGIPWGRAAFNIAKLMFWPFGRAIVDREDVTGEADLGTGPLGVLGNIIWFLFAGIWLAIGHVTSAVAYFVTIIGIPFAIQHLKFAWLSLFPIGKTTVNVDAP